MGTPPLAATACGGGKRRIAAVPYRASAPERRGIVRGSESVTVPNCGMTHATTRMQQTRRRVRWAVAQTKQVGSLQIDQDLEYQRREWVFERVGWIIVALLLLAGLLGVFGGGPLSRDEITAGPLTLEYDRLARERAPAELQIETDAGAATDGQLALWLNRAFLDKVDVVSVIPEPVEMTMALDRVTYHFAVPADQPATIVFQLQPEEPGNVAGRLGLVDGEAVAFTQFIYP
jgi:hypothetical protein